MLNGSTTQQRKGEDIYYVLYAKYDVTASWDAAEIPGVSRTGNYKFHVQNFSN
jgi:hypothetical protein